MVFLSTIFGAAESGPEMAENYAIINHKKKKNLNMKSTSMIIMHGRVADDQSERG